MRTFERAVALARSGTCQQLTGLKSLLAAEGLAPELLDDPWIADQIRRILREMPVPERGVPSRLP
ncbi:MAG: hypothetical protein IT548_13385 [Alphaproteobacteria bacterium]|nr:hypothetical protein [Alphaproteobacteria bacterium]